MGMADSRGAEAVVISRTGFTLIRTNKHTAPLTHQLNSAQRRARESTRQTSEYV